MIKEYTEAEFREIERHGEAVAEAARVWHSQRTHGHQHEDTGSTLIMGQRIWNRDLAPVGVRR